MLGFRGGRFARYEGQCALKRIGRAVEESRRRGISDTVGGDL